MTKYLAGSVFAFIACLVWLAVTWNAGNRTNSWLRVSANVVKNDVESSVDDNEFYGWKTTIEYSVNGKRYEAIVDEYLIGENVAVYVNPDNPSAVVGKPGFRIQDGFKPIVATVFFGLFSLVLLLIKLSPRDS